MGTATQGMAAAPPAQLRMAGSVLVALGRKRILAPQYAKMEDRLDWSLAMTAMTYQAMAVIKSATLSLAGLVMEVLQSLLLSVIHVGMAKRAAQRHVMTEIWSCWMDAMPSAV
jgi:hypothetical protein